LTPTEGAAVGVAGTGVIAFISGNLSWTVFKESIINTAVNTAMIFIILLGAGLYNGFLALSQVPQELSSFVVSQDFSPMMVFAVIIWFGILVLIVVEVGLITPPVGMNLFIIPRHKKARVAKVTRALIFMSSVPNCLVW